MKKKQKPFFERFASMITRLSGKPAAFIIALALIIAWAISGPLFGFSDTWQLVINTGTTIITFLMVFVIQQSQNKDTTAIQMKLNELIAASQNTSNRLIDVEDLTDAELQTIRKFYVKLAELAKTQADIHQTHSFDEAMENSKVKTNPKERKS